MPLAVLQYPQIDPFMFKIGNVGLSWYTFNYLFTIVVGYFVVRHRFRKGTLYFARPDDIGLAATYFFYGILIGARLFYIVFYNFRYFMENPLEIPAIWHGGLSFHGGFVGAIVSMWLFSRKHGTRFLQMCDAVALILPLGLGLGRITNFINGELYGRVTDVPWAMVFPGGGPLPRHPSQLYEAFLEGPILFLVMYLVHRKNTRDGMVGGVCIVTYGVLRFFVEFFREPDAQLGTVLGPFSMGQVLCFVMIISGSALIYYLKRQPPSPPPGEPYKTED